MKRKILAFLILTSIISSNGNIYAKAINSDAQSLVDSQILDVDTIDDISYKDPNYNWSEISSIEVIYTNGNDDFIKTAIENGVDVYFKPTSVVLENIPLGYYTHFSSMTWMTRDGVLSLSLNPIHPFTIDKVGGWNEAETYFRYHPNYTAISNPSKYNSLYNQYNCHVDFAKGFKTPWNIEPARPDKGYWGFVADKCN